MIGETSYFISKTVCIWLNFIRRGKWSLLIYNGLMALELMYHSLVFALSDHCDCWQKPWAVCLQYNIFIFTVWAFYISNLPTLQISHSHTQTRIASGDTRRLTFTFLSLYSLFEPRCLQPLTLKILCCDLLSSSIGLVADTQLYLLRLLQVLL